MRALIIALGLAAATIAAPATSHAFQPEFRAAGDWSLYCHQVGDGPDCTITNPQGKIGEIGTGGQMFSLKVIIWKGADQRAAATVCTVSSGKEEAVVLAASGSKVRSSDSNRPGILCFDGDRFKPAFAALYDSGLSLRLSFLGPDGHYRDAELRADGLATLIDDAFDILGITVE